MRATDQIEAELAERKRYYRNAIKDALARHGNNRTEAARALVAGLE